MKRSMMTTSVSQIRHPLERTDEESAEESDKENSDWFQVKTDAVLLAWDFALTVLSLERR
jgi:hypothetical protein